MYTYVGDAGSAQRTYLPLIHEANSKGTAEDVSAAPGALDAPSQGHCSSKSGPLTVDVDVCVNGQVGTDVFLSSPESTPWYVWIDAYVHE
jgi:hypothetical protein